MSARPRSPMHRRAAGMAATALALVLGVSIVCGSARPAAAQVLETPRARQGYYLSLGYQLALNKNWEDTRDWGVWAGNDLTLRAGQLLTRRFGLGLQIHSGGTKGQGQNASLFGLAVEGQFELVRQLTLRGGAGLDVVSISTAVGGDEKLRGTVGSGYFLGLTYDWFFTHRLTGGWAATPVVQARLVPGTTTTAFTGTIGVELTYWTGLPRNQLDLPPSEAFKVK